MATKKLGGRKLDLNRKKFAIPQLMTQNMFHTCWTIFCIQNLTSHTWQGKDDDWQRWRLLWRLTLPYHTLLTDWVQLRFSYYCGCVCVVLKEHSMLLDTHSDSSPNFHSRWLRTRVLNWPLRRCKTGWLRIKTWNPWVGFNVASKWSARRAEVKMNKKLSYDVKSVSNRWRRHCRNASPANRRCLAFKWFWEL